MFAEAVRLVTTEVVSSLNLPTEALSTQRPSDRLCRPGHAAKEDGFPSGSQAVLTEDSSSTCHLADQLELGSLHH